MNLLKQMLDFELSFFCNHIPYAIVNNANSDSGYFCIYQCYFKDGIKIYQIQANLITVINYKSNIITGYCLEPKGTIKPIVSINQKNGELYFLLKKSGEKHINIYKYSGDSNANLIHIESLVHEIHTYITKLLVYDQHIFVIQPKQIYHIYQKSIIYKDMPDIIISSVCNEQYLIVLFQKPEICLYDINNLEGKKTIDFNKEFFDCHFIHLFVNENKLYILQQEMLIQKDINSLIEKGNFVDVLYLPMLQDINQNFVNKNFEIVKKNDKSNKYRDILNFASEVNFPDEDYVDDIFFFGPSFYLPIHKHSPKSLYSNLNEIKIELFSNEKFLQILTDNSKSGIIQEIMNYLKELLVNFDVKNMNWDNEIDYFLNVIKLPESLNEESIIQSNLMPTFFNLIIAEIISTFINLLIIRVLEDDENEELNENIKIYFSLFQLINSELIQIKMKNEDIEIGKIPQLSDDNAYIQSNLYILNSAFSPLSLRQQIRFLYQGNSTFSKLSNSDVILFNSICPGPYVEQRVLDVARAYLEKNDFDKCIEYLEKTILNNENGGFIQNIFISHLIKQIPDDFEKQYIILKTFGKRLPKNMYKSFYIVSLKANQFSEAIENFYSEDALINLANEVKKNQELKEMYKPTIIKALKDKDCQEKIMSLIN